MREWQNYSHDEDDDRQELAEDLSELFRLSARDRVECGLGKAHRLELEERGDEREGKRRSIRKVLLDRGRSPRVGEPVRSLHVGLQGRRAVRWRWR